RQTALVRGDLGVQDRPPTEQRTIPVHGTSKHLHDLVGVLVPAEQPRQLTLDLVQPELHPVTHQRGVVQQRRVVALTLWLFRLLRLSARLCGAHLPLLRIGSPCPPVDYPIRLLRNRTRCQALASLVPDSSNPVFTRVGVDPYPSRT